MKNRNTLQRRLVLETVRRMHNHPTADEIFREISAENSLISKATVYRNLKILSEQGEILHIDSGRSGLFRFQHYAPLPPGMPWLRQSIRCEYAVSDGLVQ